MNHNMCINRISAKIMRMVVTLLVMVLAGSHAMAQDDPSTPTSTGVVVNGSVFGGGNQADVQVNTVVNISAGTVEGNVYGGGNEGDVGTIDKTAKDDDGNLTYNYIWTGNSPAVPATDETPATPAVIVSGKCTVSIAGTTARVKGNVFGAGKGTATTFWCEKAMVYTTSVSIENGTIGTLDDDGNLVAETGNVYGGGELGRVEYDTEVNIGVKPTGSAVTSFTPTIYGSVFGAGAGVETHGYSALVRGDCYVTIEGGATVEHNVYGGGEKATAGRYKIATAANVADETFHNAHPDIEVGMPYETNSGGKCTVIVRGDAQIGPDTDANVSDRAGHIFGAGKGVGPEIIDDSYTYAVGDRPARMTVYTNSTDFKDDFTTKNGNTWAYYTTYDENYTGTKFVWEYYERSAYLKFLQTLALVTQTNVTVSGNAQVKGSVYGGSESGFVQDDTRVTIGIDEAKTIGTTSKDFGNIFGGGRGLEAFYEAGRVGGDTYVTFNSGTALGSIYGGGELGNVGKFTETTDGRYVFNVGGKCSVSVAGGKVGADNNSDTEKGNVFGAGKGKAVTFKCEKAMSRETSVSISGGKVNGNVYGGGEVGRVEYDSEVTIGRKSTETTAGSGTGTPVIIGSVFGAGRGVVTHGYSALVRGNTRVTIEGATGSKVNGDVFGGGEIASVGRYGLNTENMPNILLGGGTCTLNVLGSVEIAGDVFGAGQGVDPGTFNNTDSNNSKRSRRMTVYTGVTDFPETAKLPNATGQTPNKSTWEYYDETVTPKIVYEYFEDPDVYSDYLETLALATAPNVTIDGSAKIKGSVYGGGELGLTKGSVTVTINNGTIGTLDSNNKRVAGTGDVYGGGSLADTNTTDKVGLKNADESPKYKNETTKEIDTKDVHPTTIVRLLGGVIYGDAYGGGLGRLAADQVLYTDTDEEVINKTKNVGDVKVAGVTAVEAVVVGDVLVDLNGTTAVTTDSDGGRTWTENTGTTMDSSKKGCIVGRVFGGNNLNGTPQKNVTVHVYATQNEGSEKVSDKLFFYYDNDEDGKTNITDVSNVTTLKQYLADMISKAEKVDIDVTTYQELKDNGSASADAIKTAIANLSEAINNKIADSATPVAKIRDLYDMMYDVRAVYGGGNEASYIPVSPYTTTNTTGSKSQVIIEGCGVTSIETVYGGGNAASVPETNVNVKSAWEIYQLFGGGNGKDKKSDGSDNPGADIGQYKNASNNNELYGTGNVNLNAEGGYIHELFGASNEKGAIKGKTTINNTQVGDCKLRIDKLYNAGRNADVEGNKIVILTCQPSTKIKEYYCGAENANVKGNVEVTITNGKFGKIFGGNNQSGAVLGHIILNVEETGCQTIEIDELYLCGNDATYSVYGYYVLTQDANGTEGDGSPNVPGFSPVLTNDKLTLRVRTSANDPHKPVKTFDANEKTWEVYTGENGDTFTPYAPPELNIVSATRIGKVFGGGFGEHGDVYGNPTVNINMIKGTPNGSEAAALGRIGVNENGTTTDCGVFGGGNAADVIGNTTVNIGTVPTVQLHESWTEADGYTLSAAKPVLGANILSNVYGGGNLADVTGNTFVNVCAVKSGDSYTAVDEGTAKVNIAGNVFGGGKGKADTFTCEKAMIGTNNKGLESNYTDGNTSVIIGNGTVNGSVYGGGEIGRVEMNTTVMIGLEEDAQEGGSGNSAPEINGNVFGAGKGLETHGYAALVRGNPTVTIQGDAKVLHSVYGGGEIASVARYDLSGGAPVALAQINGRYSGYCNVTIQGNAEIGPDGMKMYHADNEGNIDATDKPDDYGHVFAAGKGILPTVYDYVKPSTNNQAYYHIEGGYDIDQHMPKRMAFYKDKKSAYWEYVDPDFDPTGVEEGDLATQNVWEYYSSEEDYFDFIETLALATQTNLTIGGKAFVKGSAYGGSENGTVQYNTNVTIQDHCQIGQGKEITTRYEDYSGGNLFNLTIPPVKSGTGSTAEYYNLECASWDYGEDTDGDGEDDLFAPYDPNANPTTPLDKYPKVDAQNEAKSTEGGRRIATDGHTFYGNVFGGGSGSVPYFDTEKGISRYIMTAGQVKGNSNVTITGGHILTNVYGGCEATNVLGKATVKMTGGTLGVPRTEGQIRNHPVTCYLFGAGKGDQRIFFNKDTNVNDAEVEVDGGRIYGSVFGGGEDGHVMRHSLVTIKQSSGKTTKIGTTGNTYVDGNIFGGGRGFGGDALTAGNVGGCVEVNIEGGTILGSIYGGGRMASVGYGLYLTTGDEAAKYGKMREDNEYDDPTKPISTQDAQVFFAENPFTGKTFTSTGRGKIKINISNGTIGNDETNGQYGGNVFGGSMGSITKQNGENNTQWDKFATAKSTTVNVTGGIIKRSVYGGGELGTVTEDATVKVSGGTIGKSDGGGVEFGNVYGGGKGYVDPAGTSYVQAGIIKGNTSVTIEASTTTTPTIYHNIYGGGAYGSVGTFTYDTNNVITGHTANTGSATVTITGGNIGRDGNENGMIFGSSRGDVGAPGSIHDKLAWVADAHVIIGKSGSGTDLTNPHIVGSVYGSGENGHVYNNTIVDIHSGTVGITSDSPITDNNSTPDDTSDDITYTGAGYPYRGNVYGGGCGTDMYDSDDDGIDDSYNALAGIVRGTTTVNVTGGQVVRNIYGAGAMGSVGNMTTNTSTGAITFTSGGATAITISGGTVGVDGNENGNVFGAARGDKTTTRRDLALVKTTSVTISGNGEVKGSVYGGGEVGNVGSYTSTFDGTNIFTEGTGKCEVTMTGGKVDHNVFGAGKGVATNFTCDKAMAKETVVSVTGGTVTGNVYGGGEVGRVEHDTEVTIGGASIGHSVFGAGAGLATHGYSALVRGNTTLTVKDNAQIGHSIYGGGEIASVGKYGLDEHKMPSILLGGGNCAVSVEGSAHIANDVFGAGKGVETPFNSTNDDRSKRSRRMTMYNADDFPEGAMISATTGTAADTSPNGTTWEYYDEAKGLVWEYFQTKAAYDSYLTTLALATHPDVTISGNTTIGEDVFGGGELGLTKGSVIVNIDGGTIGRDVYGGGALAHTNTTSTVGDRNPDTGVTTTRTVHPTTKVNLRGGTVNGDVYGGGLGEAGTTANPDGIPAYVYGQVTVELNNNNSGGTVDGNKRGCVVNRIFGANNVNGTPKSHVLVHIYGTQNKNRSSISDKIDVTSANVDDLNSYDVTSVFGGGNAADYVPADTCVKKYAKVIIEGCDLTSIHEVYGGGYGAATPATEVLIKGTKIINNVFGGGYGAGDNNPGANVGFYTNSSENTDYPSATGKAIVQLMAGTINHVYGGSNTKGNIRGGSSVTSVDRGADAAGTGEACCDKLTILDIFGGGKSAEMFGGAEIVLGCMPNDWIGAIYGGAEAADVHSDVSLTLTSGKFERVFGGNKSSGVINGSIEVNIEENPNCDTPIIIGELYGGGNMAPYTTPAEYFTAEYPNYQSPRVNVRAFTSIGSIFGGGYGTNATVTGNPLVNINEVEGGRAYAGEEKTLEDGTKVTLYERKADGKMGVIGNVFGGGNAAPVIGQTFVNIGTAAKQKMLSLQTKDAGGNVIEVEKDVLGADIRGNVYGGGDEATVTGKTNVVIGQKKVE